MELEGEAAHLFEPRPDEPASDPLNIAGRTFNVRLILGTGGAASVDALERALRASRAELVTVALRRVDPASRGSVLDVIERCGCQVLPNTAGCYT
ncbi:MAG: hypothetical protein M3252_06245, partial [Actinomycetota bacterium]|nr:hypothetical protein [Actinomycetota bacterium]